MRGWMLALLLVACGGDGDGKRNPVEFCDQTETSDCCANDAQCFDFYGREYPFCINDYVFDDGSSKRLDICAECREHSHCGAGEVCYPDPDWGGFCFPATYFY